MAQPTYDPTRTGLLFVDPYNDFLSEGGKLWPRVSSSRSRWIRSRVLLQKLALACVLSTKG
jgi:hypothetical protein